MEQETVTGIILSAQPMGEYDKRIVILTKERGKISAFARGARRQNSLLLAATNPFVYGKFGVYEGRNSYTVTNAEAGNYFSYFSTHLEEAWLGFYFLEYADYYCHENNDEFPMLELLYYSLLAITNNNHDPELIRRIFEWKALVIRGEYPDVFECSNCKKNQGEFYFNLSQRNIVCSDCKKGDELIKLDQSALYAFQFITNSDFKQLYSFNLTEKVKENFIEVVDEYYKRYHYHDFNALNMWEQMK